MLAGEKWATPGNHIAFFELEGVPSTVIICHDERYPELVRLPAIQVVRVVYYSCESAMAEEGNWLHTAACTLELSWGKFGSPALKKESRS